MIRVADNGIGIPTEQLDRVLQPFTQIEHSYIRQHEGAGLGLPLAKQYMELHGGQLEITSDKSANSENGGTVVTLYLPAHRILRLGISRRG